MPALNQICENLGPKHIVDLEKALERYRDLATATDCAITTLKRLLTETLGRKRTPFHARCTLFLLTPDGTNLKCAISVPDKFAARTEAFVVPMDNRLMWTLREQQDHKAHEGYHLGWITPGLAEFGKLSLPITADNDFLGVLIFEPHGGDDLSLDDMDTLGRFGRKLGKLLAKPPLCEPLGIRTTAVNPEKNEVLDLIYSETIFSRTDIAGRIVDVNDAFCLISGYQRSELVGQSHRVINSDFHGSDFWVDFWTTVRSGNIWRGEICNRNKNGQLYWVDSIVAPMRDDLGRIDSYISVRFDITERKKGEEAISRFGRILDGSSDEIYIIDKSTLRVLQANAVACTNLGYEQGDLTSMRPDGIISKNEVKKFQAALQTLAQGKVEKVEIDAHHVRRDGSTYPVWIRLTYASEETPPVYVASVLDITEQKKAQAEIERLAYTDSLTGLPNRACTLNRLEELAWSCTDDSRNLSVLFLDLDRFKEVNDTRGHAIGDSILKTVAARFCSALNPGDFVGRVGGDEFVVALPNASDIRALNVADAICALMKKPVVVDGEMFFLGVSLGIATARSGSCEPEALLRQADTAMCHAKDTMSGIALYHPNMTRELRRKRDIAIWLKKTLEDNSLTFAFQPQVDLLSQELVGAEVLLRWAGSPIGEISPGEFIPIAEERGMMPELGDWAFANLCKLVSGWNREGWSFPGRLAINISASQLTARDFQKKLSQTLETHRLSPQLFELEITEHALMKDGPRGLETLKNLRNEGYSIAIDDFGTGYSSLSHLKSFAADKLKVDLSFVRDMHDDDASYAIVSAIIAMGEKLGMKVVAEGVEREKQASELRSLGCELAQGFLYSKPMPADHFLQDCLTRPLVDYSAARHAFHRLQ